MTREALTRGTELDRYVLRQVLHEDGRGISYLGVDTGSVSGASKVLVREYFPRGISVRGAGLVAPRDRKEARDEFELGLSGFIDAANALIELQTHTLVPALNLVEENGTAYLVLEWPEGRPFSELSTEEAPMRAELLRSHLAILLPGLGELHKAGLLHTGLSPETLIRLDDGYPAISRLTHIERFDDEGVNRTHLLLDSPYAAPELNSRSSAKIGPWTDIYSLSATCWFLLTGAAPPSAAARLAAIAAGRGDPLTKEAFAGLSEEANAIADVLLEGLDLMSEKRIPSAIAFAHALNGRSALLPALFGAPIAFLSSRWGAATAIAAVLAIGAVAFGMSQDKAREYAAPKSVESGADKPALSIPLEVTSNELALPDKTGSEPETSAPETPAEDIWQLADHEDAVAVREFLAANENDPEMLAVAFDQLELLDARAWSVAMEEGTAEAFGAYLKNFSASMTPPGVHADAAERRITELTGQRDFQIAEARRLLFALGYKTNVPRGETPGLRRAVIGFQESIGAPVDGNITDALIEQLSAELARRDQLAEAAIEEEQPALEAVIEEEQAAEDAPISEEDAEIANERFVELVKEAAMSSERSATGEIGRPETQQETSDAEALIEPPTAEPEVIYETKIASLKIESGTITVEKLEPEKAPARNVGENFRDCPTCPEVVVIPAGSFTMGSPENERGRYKDEGPAHTVEIQASFAMGKFEVTLDQYQEFVRATEREISDGCSAESSANDGSWVMNDALSFQSPGFAQTGGHPVSCVSWNDAKAYTDWLSDKTGQSYRLATEAEWEYAARAGSNEARHFGASYRDGCKHGNGADRTARRAHDHWITAKCSDGHVATAPVGSFRANAFGLYDMIGNVWEWTEDCYSGSYAGSPRSQTAHVTSTCRSKVTRGGSWAAGPEMLRSAARSADVPTARYDMLGFRIVRELAAD